MKFKNHTLAALSLLLPVSISAQTEEGIKLQFNFENVSGASVSDATGSGVTARVMSSAKVEEMGTYHVLNLGNGTGYLDMTSAAGELFKAQDDYSISVYYRVNENATITGAGNFLWTFTTQTACSSTAGKYSAYRVNAQRYATSTGGYNNETGVQVGSASEKGVWKHVVYTESAGKGSLYIDGTRVGTVSNMPANSTNYASEVLNYCWIGRPPFSSDAYLTNTLVTDFRIYGKALTASEITELAGKTADLEYQYSYGSAGDKTKLLQTLSSAEELFNGDTSAYPQGAINELEDVVTYIKDVTSGTISQNLIDKYVTLLNSSVTTFKSSKGKTFNAEGITEDYDTNRGFKHPGMLHTDADFERIRQQIADGDATVTAAYNVLKTAGYAQSSAQAGALETIVRGGGVGENYIIAARAATIAYQNGLRWKIEGNKGCAKHAQDVLVNWANTCKAIGGDSNYALAAGLYGYEFANAAELVRDYNDWDQTEEFKTVQRWFRNVWYPNAINFMRGRNGTWENPGKWWEAPGHYWSNWGLCCDLCVMSIGILCDDPFIYNQGLSFYKYDQCNTWHDLDPNNLADGYVWNWGLTEFLGNLVPIESDCPAGLESPFGKLSQMQESGRDQGHTTMALGLAVDICQTAWNQGDDLYSYMNNRLAGGIEHIAAYNYAGADNVPFVTYKRQDSGYTLADGRGGTMTGVSGGSRGQVRPFWGRVIGHYEGVKGIKMKYSEIGLSKMGIDGGGAGNVSGAYDHLGYSVLTCTRPAATEKTMPTLLTPKMEYNGKIYEHNELGGLTNTYRKNLNTCLAKGQTVKLMPQLPEGTTDTGKWKWNTGETTKDITVPTDRSYIYRATYTNENGVESEQVFSLAVNGDCNPALFNSKIYSNGEYVGETEAEVFYGSNVTITTSCVDSYFGSVLWDNGQTDATCNIAAITRDRDVSVIFTNQGGRQSMQTYHIKVKSVQPNIKVNSETKENVTEVVVNSGDEVVITPYVTSALAGGTYEWSDGSSESTLNLGEVEQTGSYTLHYTYNDAIDETLTFNVFVIEDDSKVMVDPGNYLIRHVASDTYLTNDGDSTISLKKLNETGNAQKWCINRGSSARYDIISLADSTYIKSTGELVEKTYRTQRIALAKGANYCIFCNSSSMYWTVDPATLDINFEGSDQLYSYPFELIPVEYDPTAIQSVSDYAAENSNDVYNLQGQVVRKNAQSLDGLTPGIYIINNRKVLVK